MNGKLLNIAALIGLNIAFALLLSETLLYLCASGMTGAYGILIIFLLMISLLPILNHFQKLITAKIIVADSDDPFIQEVDSIVNIESFDELLKEKFDRILSLMNARIGGLFFYNHEKKEFELFYQKSRKKKLKNEIEIHINSVLMDRINGPNDILIKGWLDPLNIRENHLIEEMKRIESDIVIPIYYQKIIMGLILIGGKKRFTEKEIRLLRIFASKIAINVQNSFYFNNILKKKEMEKEYELTYKLQKQFMPFTKLRAGRLNFQIYHRAASSVTREFYDVFAVDPNSDEIRVSAYRIHGDIKETSILMPGVKALLQCFARLGYSPRESISVLVKIGTEKDVLLGDFSILHSLIRQDGTTVFCNTGYPAPFLYKKKSTEFLAVLGENTGARELKLHLETGDIVIIASRKFYKFISGGMDEFRGILEKNFSLSLDDIKIIIVNRLADKAAEAKNREDEEAEDRLLILIRMEENAG